MLVLGVAYKPDIDDLRESPALDVLGLLRKKGAEVTYHDPYIPHLDHDGWQMDSVPDLMKAVETADCVVIVTNHSGYDYPAILARKRSCWWTRAMPSASWGKGNPKVVRL